MYERQVVWPKLDTPVYITRDVFVPRLKDEKTDRTGVCKKVVLEVLVPHTLYLVVKNGQGLRRGTVLSRNLELTRVNGRSSDRSETHAFQVYDDVFAALRHFSRVDDRYRAGERPALQRWRRTVDELKMRAWTLHEADEGERQSFAWIAQDAVSTHHLVRNPLKTDALARTRQIASVTDRTGRRNPGMVPLLCLSVDTRLTRRIQSIRGIGRRMDWRAAVLEHYVDQLQGLCRQIMFAARQRLQSAHVFGQKRTTKTVRETACRIRVFAKRLGKIHARPFTRSTRHVARDLDKTAVLMLEAADARDGSRMDDAAALLRRIYRSMRMQELHWILQELYAMVSASVHGGTRLSNEQVRLLIVELHTLQNHMRQSDPFTREPLEQGFRNPVLPDVLEAIQACLDDLTSRQSMDEGLHRAVYDHLRRACIPF